MASSATVSAPKKRKSFSEYFHSMRGQQLIVTLVFLFVPLVLLFMFTYLPFFKMVEFSFFKMKYIGRRTFVGLQNYISVFTRKDCFHALSLSLYYMVGSVVQMALALLFALTSNDIISYITKMISMIMSGMFICTMLGRFWTRFNWQGAVAALAGGAGASVAVLVDSDWLAFWGNPCIPAVLTSLVASVVVTLLTPASSMSREQALEMITRERESRPTPPPLPIGKRHTSRGNHERVYCRRLGLHPAAGMADA